MFKKLKTSTLIIILVVLGGIAALNKFYFSKQSESTFSDEFVKIDTGLVTEILIYPKVEQGKGIKITKGTKGWELSREKIKTVADSNAVHNLIASFANIKSIALAGADKSSWKELETDDSTGSRIKIITSENKTYDFVVGKFGFNQNTRSGVTYIRKTDEESVYTIDGFLSFSVNQPFSAWRNKTLISGNKDSWNTLIFTYPGDSSFVLAKQNNAWTVNGIPADSTKVSQYLNQLASIQSSSFADNYSPAATPLYTLNIQGNNQPAPLIITAYPADTIQKFVLHSTLNADAWFTEGQTNTVGRVFVGSKSFFAETSEPAKK
jgi:hypothetical protein